MPSLKDLRRSIGSVKNTRQITKAMKLVAASKLRRAQEAIDGARPFAEKLEELTQGVVADITRALQNADEAKRAAILQRLHSLLNTPVLSEDGDEKRVVALIVISSDRGLCGAYNNNALRAGLKRYKELVAQPRTDVKLYFAGRRANDFFRKRGIAGEWLQDMWVGKFSSLKTDKLATLFTEKFMKGEVQAVEAVFTQFKSVISQQVARKQLLPLSLELAATPVGNEVPSTDAPFIFEPKKEKLLAELLPQQVKIQFYRVFADSMASEFGARMTAMDNATRNAEGMISRLTLQANRVRQAAITKEICEIVGGAEALKG